MATQHTASTYGRKTQAGAMNSSSSGSTVLEHTSHPIPTGADNVQIEGPIEAYIKNLVKQEFGHLRNDLLKELSIGDTKHRFRQLSVEVEDTHRSGQLSVEVEDTHHSGQLSIEVEDTKRRSTIEATTSKNFLSSPSLKKPAPQSKIGRISARKPTKSPLSINVTSYARTVFDKVEAANSKSKWLLYATQKSNYNDFCFDPLILQNVTGNLAVESVNITQAQSWK